MSESIRPLTMTTKEGKPYTRSPVVSEEIAGSLAWSGSELLEKHKSLSNEALLYHLRRFRESDGTLYGALLHELGLRTIRIVKGTLRGIDRLGKEDIAMQVEMEILELAIAVEPSRKSEFLEVAFTQAVRRRALNLRTQFQGTIEAHRGRHKQASIPDLEREKKKRRPLELATDGRESAEAALVALQDEQFRDQAWETVQAALTGEDERMLLAFRLIVVDRWPLWSADSDVPTVARHFGLTRGQAKYLLERTRKIIDEVIRSYSGDKAMTATGVKR